MGTRLAIFFEVNDETWRHCQACQDLPDWHAVLSRPAAQMGEVYLDLGESIACWRAVLEGLTDDPLYPLFFGEINSEQVAGTSGAPDAYFLGPLGVRKAFSFLQDVQFADLSKYYDSNYLVHEIEAYFGPMKDFLRQIVGQERALFALWR